VRSARAERRETSGSTPSARGEAENAVQIFVLRAEKPLMHTHERLCAARKASSSARSGSPLPRRGWCPNTLPSGARRKASCSRASDAAPRRGRCFATSKACCVRKTSASADTPGSADEEGPSALSFWGLRNRSLLRHPLYCDLRSSPLRARVETRKAFRRRLLLGRLRARRGLEVAQTAAGKLDFCIPWATLNSCGYA